MLLTISTPHLLSDRSIFVAEVLECFKLSLSPPKGEKQKSSYNIEIQIGIPKKKGGGGGRKSFLLETVLFYPSNHFLSYWKHFPSIRQISPPFPSGKNRGPGALPSSLSSSPRHAGVRQWFLPEPHLKVEPKGERSIILLYDRSTVMAQDAGALHIGIGI